VRAYAISILTWELLALMMAWQVHLINTSANPNARFREALLFPVVRYFCYSLLTPPLFYLVGRYPIRRPGLFLRIAAYMGGALLFVSSFSFLRLLLMPPYDIARQVFLPRSFGAYFGLITGTFTDQLSAYIGILMVAHTMAFHAHARDAAVEKSELQQALAASELQMLKTQLHPHFLFNTLHGINELMSTDPALAKVTLVKLSDLLRAALKHSSSDVITLRDELEFAGDYLDLQQMRLGSRLEVRLCVSPSHLDCLVPQLILQPLLENAITHGVACCREGGWLEIVSRLNDSELRLEVINSVGGKSERGSGFGIGNCRGRLRSLYGDEASFEFTLNENRTAHAVLRIPALGATSLTAVSPSPALSRARLSDAELLSASVSPLPAARRGEAS